MRTICGPGPHGGAGCFGDARYGAGISRVLDVAAGERSEGWLLLRADGPTEEEVHRARAYAAGRRVLGFENTNAVARYAAGRAIVHHEDIDPDRSITTVEVYGNSSPVRRMVPGFAMS